MNMNYSYTVSIQLGIKYKVFGDKWSAFKSWLCRLLMCAIRQVVYPVLAFCIIGGRVIMSISE